MIDAWTFAVVAVITLSGGVTAITLRALRLAELLDRPKDSRSRAQRADEAHAETLEGKARQAELNDWDDDARDYRRMAAAARARARSNS